MSREAVETDNAPKAIGPYVQAIKANGLVYTAGQIPIDPKAGNIVEGGDRGANSSGAGKSKSGLDGRGFFIGPRH